MERRGWKITCKEQGLAAERFLNARSVFNSLFVELHCPPQRLLFSWGPGSVGEQLGEGTGIKVERGHYLLLQVLTQKN